ncbi:hypothetical protein NW762_012123 [Fusarium torreyae]|uniref:F-box domain-containing protein n=1 Tax=Fusarium torreyae TaxID=1237075 RepID=A0A9W8VBQ0_9HYPO|nr:hypothetical protein NW762_012123 [Fusarium torreyae]
MRRRRGEDVDASSFDTDGPYVLPAERWTLLAPKKKQQMKLPSLENDSLLDLKPSYFCTLYLSFDAFKLLCNTNENVKTGSKLERGQHSFPMTAELVSSRTQLESLPSELLSLVFALLDPGDFISLGLCSQSLWAHAIIWAQSGFLRWSNEYSWAGTPMICVASKLRELPQSIYSMFPESIPEGMPEEHDTSNIHGWKSRFRPTQWHNDMIKECEKRPDPYDDQYLEEFWKHIHSAGIPKMFHEPMAASFPSFSIESGSKWCLRNLTQKEYIRMEGIVTSDGEATVCFVGNHWLTLDILLIWLITWRGDRFLKTWSWEQLDEFVGVTDEGLGDIMIDPTYGPLDHKFWPIWAGRWAGHSFDVVNECTLGAEWVDRSSNIDSLSGKMLRTLYGLALAEVEEARDYWAEIFEKSGGVVDLQLREYGTDSD